jgi:hypothetical protein
MSKSHLDIESPLFDDKPHIWLQWKGTNVCCDIHCLCGWHGHFDGLFFYFFRCPSCGKVYEVGSHVSIYQLADNDQRIASSQSIQEPSLE